MPVVAVPVVEHPAGMPLPRPLTPATVRCAAGVALRSIDLVPSLRPTLDGFLRDRRLSPSVVARIAGELLEAHGFTAGDEVPPRDVERVLAAAMRQRRSRLPL